MTTGVIFTNEARELFVELRRFTGLRRCYFSRAVNGCEWTAVFWVAPWPEPEMEAALCAACAERHVALTMRRSTIHSRELESLRRNSFENATE